jgi:transposase-like protein
MSKGKPRDLHKEQHWRELLQRWQASGLSIADFCRQHQLAPPAFYAWRRTLRQRDQPANSPTNAEAVTFVPLHIRPDTPTARPPLELVLRNGRILRVPDGWPLDSLPALLTVLEDPPC